MDFARQPLEEVVAALFAGAAPLSADDLDTLCTRPDLASSAERLALLERAVVHGPGREMRLASEALVAWLVTSLTRDRFQKARPVLSRLWGGRGASAISTSARRGLDEMGDRTARQARAIDDALAKGTIPWDVHHPSKMEPAIAGLIELAPETAFDRVGPLLARERVTTDTGAQLAKDVLWQLQHRAPEIGGDPRWIDALDALAGVGRLRLPVAHARQALDTARRASEPSRT